MSEINNNNNNNAMTLTDAAFRIPFDPSVLFPDPMMFGGDIATEPTVRADKSSKLVEGRPVYRVSGLMIIRNGRVFNASVSVFNPTAPAQGFVRFDGVCFITPYVDGRNRQAYSIVAESLVAA